MSDDLVTLLLGGQAFTAWETVSVSRDIDQVCAQFDLGLFISTNTGVDLGAITDQAPITLKLGDDTVITGYVDRPRDGLGIQGSRLSVSGRDKTCDLVDCSAVHSPGQWRNQTLEAITRALIAPFGLTLDMETSPGAAFGLFALEPGETVIEAVGRMCRMRGLMVRSSPKGALVIYSQVPQRGNGSLEYGRNLIEVSTDFDSAGRYSHYILKGQHQGGDVAPKDAALPKATATDPGVKRYRPLVVIADEQSTLGALRQRALWEAQTRRGRGLVVNATVKGWRDDAGKLWEPGVTVPLRIAARGLETDMMIAGVTFTRDTTGTRTALRLMPPEAFTIEPIAPPKPAKRSATKRKTDAAYQALVEG